MNPTQTPDTFAHLITPVRSGNVFEETLEKVVTYITSGVLLPGDKLPSERELSDQLGVSKATTHDVINEVQKLGFIEIKRGRYGGAYILNNSPVQPKIFTTKDIQEVIELMEYRAVLESAAARHAALRPLTGAARQELMQALKETEQADTAHYRILDSRLHLTIAHMAGIPRLTQQLVGIRSEVNELLNQFPLLNNNIRNSNSQHREMIEAILAGDSTKAAMVAEEHVQGTAALIRALAT